MRDAAKIVRSSSPIGKGKPRKVLIIVGTIVLGLAAGVMLHYLAQQPPRPRTVGQLIHALQKQDTPLHDFWQDVWIALPDWLTSRCGLIQPRRALLVRANAANELSMLGSAAARAVPFLAQALHDPEQVVQSAALFALRDLGPVAQAATPALIDYFNDPALVPIVGFPDFRAEVATVMMTVSPDDNRVVHTLLTNALRHPDTDFRARLLVTLGSAKAPPPPLLSAVQSSLLSTNPPIRDAAIRAAGQLGPRAAGLVPTLIEVFGALVQTRGTGPPTASFSSFIAQRANPIVSVPAVPGGSSSVTVASNLVLVARPGTNQAPIFVSRYGFPAWQANDRFEESQIIDALGQIGPGAKAAVPLLIRESTNTYRAVLARWHIDGDASAAIAALEPFLARPTSAAVRCSIVECLPAVGPDAVPLITRMLDQPETTVRLSAVLALGQCGSAAAPAVPTLEKLLAGDSKYCIRSGAATALKRIAPARTAEWKAKLPPLWPEAQRASALE